MLFLLLFLYFFFLQMPFVRHHWKLSEKRQEWLFDGLSSSWIDRAGCYTLSSNPLTPLWQLKWTISCVACMSICSNGPATKCYYGNFQQKAHGWHREGGLGSHCVTIILQRGVQRKPLLFECQNATCRFQSSPLSPLFLHQAHDGGKELAALG